MIFTVTRDSVCAADDVDAPHKKRILIVKAGSERELIESVLKKYPLPQIAGNQATWVVERNERKVAVIAQQWNKPRLLEEKRNKGSQIHFKYLSQECPQETYKNLKDNQS